MTYDEYCKTHPDATRDQFEQFLNEKYDAAFNEGTYLHMCLEQASLRIAELERENAELRKDKVRLDFVLERRCRMPIESTNGWIVQEWVGHTTGRGDSPRAALDAAMHRAGEQK